MLKYEFIEKLSEKLGTNKKEARKFLNVFIDTFKECLLQDRIVIPGFIVGELKEIPSRTVRNPQNGKLILAPDRLKIKLKISRALKEKIRDIKGVSGNAI
jgi:nucleoid DNA-binding protein